MRRWESGDADGHSRLYEMRPMGRWSYRGFDYLVGVGGPFYDQPEEYPTGYYQSVYYILQGERVTSFATQEYDKAKEYLTYDNDKARVAACRQTAEQHIEDRLQAREELENGASTEHIQIVH